MQILRTAAIVTRSLTKMRWVPVLMAAALSCAGAGCSQSAESTTLRTWQFRQGLGENDPGKGTGDWHPIAFPAYFRTTAGFEDYKGWITFRAEIPRKSIPRAGESYAVFGGMISDVSKVYFNETLVGSMGSADPYRPASFLTFLRSLPPDISTKASGNFLYLCVYTDGTYPIYVMEYPRIGPAEIVYGDYYKSEIVSFILLSAYLLVGLYHLHLWIRRRKDLYNLFFGLLCVFLCCYWLVRQGSRDIVFGDHVLIRTKIEFIVLFLLGPFLLFFLSQFFHARYDRLGLFVAPFFGALAVITALGSYTTARICLTIWQLTAIPTMAYCVFYIGRELFRGNPETKYLIPGVAALMLAGMHDIAAIRGWISTPMIARFAYPVFILGSAAVLARRFVKLHNHVEELLHNFRQLESLRSEFASVEDAGRDIASLLGRMIAVLKNIFGFESAFAVVSDQFGTLHGTGEIPKYIRVYMARAHISYQRNSLKPEFFEYCGPVFRIDPAVAALEGKTGSHLARARATRRVFERLASDDFRVGISILNRKEIFGALFLGPRAGGSPYTAADLSAMQTFQFSITQAVGNSILFAEISKLKGEAEDRVEKLSDYVIERSKAYRHEMDEKTLVYSSSQMMEVFEKARKYAQASQPVLITGETGTGKELVARTIHQCAGNPSSPFVAINCAAIPENLWESEVFGHSKGAYTGAAGSRDGLVEQAGDGTLFFDEIGEMPLSLQAKMLRLIQERKFQRVGGEAETKARCRFLFATNRDLATIRKTGAFREDLYYRIGVFQISIPPLRERRADIPALFEHFVSQYAEELKTGSVSVEKAVQAAVYRYSWPGNVRELENAVIQTMVHSKDHVIRLRDLPPALRKNFHSSRTAVLEEGSRAETAPVGGTFEEILGSYTRKVLERALEESQGNKVKAAQMLGMKRTTFYNKLKDLGLN